MLIRKLILGFVIEMVVFGALLFIPAGTLAWWRAWVFLGVFLVAGVLATIALLPGHEDLLNERLQPVLQKGQPLADKIIIILLLGSFIGMIVLIPLDVFRWHLLARPGPIVAAAGLVMFAGGWWIMYLAMRENPFASPVVKHLTKRRQRVIDTGVYGLVRHPMYAGAIPFFLGIPLWLESYAAALLAGVLSGILVVRIRIEEQFLQRELEGYEAYMQRVPYRLIPFIW